MLPRVPAGAPRPATPRRAPPRPAPPHPAPPRQPGGHAGPRCPTGPRHRRRQAPRPRHAANYSAPNTVHQGGVVGGGGGWKARPAQWPGRPLFGSRRRSCRPLCRAATARVCLIQLARKAEGRRAIGPAMLLPFVVRRSGNGRTYRSLLPGHAASYAQCTPLRQGARAL